jgi:hypothetical protein
MVIDVCTDAYATWVLEFFSAASGT